MAVGAHGDEVFMMAVVNRPQGGAVRFGQGEPVDGLAGEESEAALMYRRGQGWNRAFALEKEEQPMVAAFVRFLRDHSEQVEVFGRDVKAGFLGGLACRAFERRLSDRGLEFAADGAPCAEIRRLRPQKKKVFALVIFYEYKNGDLMGWMRTHAAIGSCMEKYSARGGL